MAQSQTIARISPVVYGITQTLNRICLKLFFKRIHFYGLQHIPPEGPYVLAVKHYSRWDPLVIALVRREPHWFMTNANQFSGFQGWLIQRLGAFPVDLARPQLSSMRHTITILRQGAKLVIFPEGGIVRDQLLRPLKPGLARLVLQAESALANQATIPIIPIAIRYLPAAQWRATVQVEIGAPVQRPERSQGSEKAQAEQLTAILDQTMRSQLEQLYPKEGAESGIA